MRDASESKTNEVLDPVCGMRFDVSLAVAEARHDGTTYYFCATGCRDAFIPDPERFLDEEEIDDP